MRILALKTNIQHPLKIVKNKFLQFNSAPQKQKIKKFSGKTNNIFNKIKNLYYTLKENIYLAKYKLKEYVYSGYELPEGSIGKIDKPTKTRFCQRLKPYLKSVFDNNIDPAKLDKKLTKLAVHVREEEFSAKGYITIGRKKIYTMPNGKEIILETHNYKDPVSKVETVVTRIYDRSAKQNRDYVDLNGNFVHGNNGYKSKKAHLQSGKKGLDWVMAK